MTGHDERVHDVFVAALAETLAGRDALIAEAFVDDPSAAEEVRELLRLHDEMALADAAGATDDGGSVLGARLGPYEIVRSLGTGGMGQVYLARRADGRFQRDVAIKVMSAAHRLVHDLRPRFEEERRILASLRHPHIASLLDAGELSDGRLYLVMEYVDGRSLTEHCEQHALDRRQRLELFVKICDAVAHAHRTLVVHRDLKPANILVGADGEPKLLDFGIAKAITQGRVDLAPTLPWLRRASPGYASPEHLNGRPAHTTMDVFALGVVLHELLTGAPPRGHHTGDAISSFAVKTAQPGAPAGRGLSDSLVAPHDRSALGADLAAIVDRALDADWTRRYRSVDELSADLRASLAGRPVRARNAGAGYRVIKFVKRNVLLTTVGLIAAVSSIVAMSLLAARWQQLQRDRAHSVQQAAAARIMADGLFAANDTLLGIDGTTSARRVVADALGTYLTSMHSSEGGRVSLQIAEAYRRLGDIEGNPHLPNLGHLERAFELYGRAIATSRSLLAQGPDPDTRLGLARALAGRADVSFARRDLAGAEGDYTEALRLAKELVQNNRSSVHYQQLVAGVHRPLGDLKFARGDIAGALVEYEGAVAAEETIAAESPGSVDARRLRALTRIRLGDAHVAAGALTTARSDYQAAIDSLRSLAADGISHRNVLRDAALGLARLGSLVGQDDRHAGADMLSSAVKTLDALSLSDPADNRARRDLVAVLLQYVDVSASVNAVAARNALSRAYELARQLRAQEPANPLRQRELADIESRLAQGDTTASASLRLVGAETLKDIQVGESPPRSGERLKAIASSAPPGWTRYVMQFGADGEARLLDEAQLKASAWTLPIAGPGTSQTVLLLVLPQPLSSDTRTRLLNAVSNVAGPRVIDFDSQVVWSHSANAIQSVASARGRRDTVWVDEVRRVLATVPRLVYAGRTFYLAPAS